MFRITLTAVAVCLLAAPASAQRLWISHGNPNYVGIDIRKGFFDTDDEFSVSATTLVATGIARFALSSSLKLTAELPFARASVSGFGESESNSSFGNPWVGFEIQTGKSVAMELGVRAGISDPDELPAAFAILADFDRFEAWASDVTTLRGIAHIGNVPEHGQFVTGFVGGSFFLPQDGDSEFFADYGIRAGVRGSTVMVAGEFTGRYTLTGDDAESFSDRTVHQLGITVEGVKGKFRPRIGLSTYLDESARVDVKAVLTLGFVAPLR